MLQNIHKFIYCVLSLFHRLMHKGLPAAGVAAQAVILKYGAGRVAGLQVSLRCQDLHRGGLAVVQMGQMILIVEHNRMAVWQGEMPRSLELQQQ